MTADEFEIPAAPTPRTHAQAAAIWGGNAVEQQPDEYLVYTLLVYLTPDDPALPIPAPTVEADIAAVRARMPPEYERSATR